MDWLESLIEQSGLEKFLFDNHKELYFFGTGETTRITIEALISTFPGIKIGGVLDNFPRDNSCINGVPVIFTGDLRDVIDKKVIIASKNVYQMYMDSLRIGFHNEDIFCPSTTYVMDGTFMNNWVTGTVIYKKMIDILSHRESIRELYNQLDDNRSKEVLEAVMKFRLLQEPKYITRVCSCTNSDYWEEGPFGLSEAESFVDVGALNGDTSLEFITRTKGRYEHIYIIEPDAYQISQAMDSIFTLENRDRISYFHMALGAYNGVAHINNGIVGENGGTVIRTMRLDDLLYDKRISLIKMDIEGAEMDALKGACRILKEQKPKLCICVYHKSTDLWEIPAYIKSIRSDYRLALRQGSPGVYGDVQTVLYAY